MIKSMTGYGKADFQLNESKLDLEIKSVNHRFCEVSIQNIPQDLKHLETKIKKTISMRFSRGHFYLSFRITSLPGNASSAEFFFNTDLVEKCFRELSELKKKFQIAEDISLSHLIAFQDKFLQKTPPVDYKALGEHIDGVLDEAMTGLEKMRKEEGAALARDLISRLALIKEKIKEIADYREMAIQNYKKRLLKKIDELKSAIEVDPQRIAQEVIFFSDRMDVLEEMTRLSSHLEQFKKMIEGNEPAGRGMDFLLQEMNREMNTVVSKTGGTATTLLIKQELEILREQVQNVE
jgi:uncharacterized protein (TIGR00255 family)